MIRKGLHVRATVLQSRSGVSMTMTLFDVTYNDAALFCFLYHRHLPKPPPVLQIRRCIAAGGRRTHVIAMLGNTVSPHLSRTHIEVRRMISDGRLYGGCSALYRLSADYAHSMGKSLVTYTFNRDAVSVVAAGGVYDGERRGGRDTRQGRVNATAGITKHRWVWRLPPNIVREIAID